MVKIKDGYVMSPREKAEFDRVNALSRKTSGQVAYYYKPQTKYPPRVYVFMHAEIWCDRNRRPMGLHTAFPFLTRPMNREEIEYHHFNIRLCYHQYEDWDKLLNAEQKEAELLDLEKQGTGSGFLAALCSFRTQYMLGTMINTSETGPVREDGEAVYLRSLIERSAAFDGKQLGELLAAEQQGEKRLAVLILLRELYKNIALPDEEKTVVTEALISRKVKLSKDRTRRNFVRRVYRKNKLFALAEIREKYPDYPEDMLMADLVSRKFKTKRGKKPPFTDLRRCQLQKMAGKISNGQLPQEEYHKLCCRIVMLQQAHNSRVPIPIKVTLGKVTKVYYFRWQTRESVVKSFVCLANLKNMTHEHLRAKHEEMVSSNYSY